MNNLQNHTFTFNDDEVFLALGALSRAESGISADLSAALSEEDHIGAARLVRAYSRVKAPERKLGASPSPTNATATAWAMRAGLMTGGR